MGPDARALEAFIRQRMRVSSPPGLDELRLHLAGPTAGLQRFMGENAAEPYWAFAWGGGLALARHILDHPETVRGRRVLDLGAGSGLVAIAAMTAGAASAVAIDVDPNAAVAVRLNAALNHVAVEAVTGDLLDGPSPKGISTVLVGDLFYEVALADRVLAFLRRCRAADVDVLIGDPGRRPLPVAALTSIGAPPKADFGGAVTGGGVFRFPE
ncbi:class I SAM-dependent methyltransferase [Brevundimonas sp. VNH65]|uniref:class I SAM-dependent methyltransferase n=1 Tax=Brevundimonas sp. VNH65 TaxID=3400917 RepID=UPI003C0ABD2A